MNVVEQFKEKLLPFGVPLVIHQVGSHAYGLNTETSDEDFRGIFLPLPEYVIGLKTVEQVKILGDDWVSHNIQQFVHILIKQNPTFMELLFIENPIYKLPMWDDILPHLKTLIHRGAFKPYSAYVRSQLAKSDREFIGKRRERAEALDYCPKFMAHTARLAVQGTYLMREGYIPVKVPEPFRTDIMKIRRGTLPRTEVLSYCDELDKKMHEAYKNSTLPESIDINKFEKEFYIPLMKKFVV